MGSRLVSSGAQFAACTHPVLPIKRQGFFPGRPLNRALGTSQPGSVILRTPRHGRPELVHAGSAPPRGVGGPGGRPAAAFCGLLVAQRADFTPRPHSPSISGIISPGPSDDECSSFSPQQHIHQEGDRRSHPEGREREQRKSITENDVSILCLPRFISLCRGRTEKKKKKTLAAFLILIDPEPG